MMVQMDTYKAKLGEAKPDYEYIETDSSGRYGRFKEVLGKGAMKTVYKAFDQVRGMEVAWSQVKLNDVFQSPEELQRLYSEVHLLSTLNHDSIIRFYTSWIDVNRRTFNFITEMLTSGTLREYRQRYKQVDIRAVKNWARQILNGLVYLHGHDPPVIHRDLKCDNIFVNGHLGQVKIGDLGFAAVLQGSSHAHSVIGTPEFMAPELYEEEYDELVDIYSFGMCVLEMLTSEYPYGECTNPAQIYKKVTSGKLPDAFYRIHDDEARKFVGKCLQTASKRLPAKDLLLDPFLASDAISNPNIRNNDNPIVNDIDTSEYVPSSLSNHPTWSSDMKITGKMNPGDDTIYLKVQIADKYGSTRNIYFPFDILSDTPIDVATEMVKELEINDREPDVIADIIEKEISALVPHWKNWEDPTSSLHENHPHDDDHHSFTYNLNDDYDNDENDGTHLPFYSLSSCSSSQASLSGLLPPSGSHCNHGDYNREMIYGCNWLHQDDDDASSQSSLHSGLYSNMNYQSGSEHDSDPSPSIRENHPHQILNTAKCTTRFCPETNGGHHHKQEFHHQEAAASSSKDYRRTAADNRSRQLTRMKSFVDVRSQLLHRSLVEEVNKRRLFKTVGAVENIGYQSPIEAAAPPSSPTRAGWSVNGGGLSRYGKNKQKGFKW